MERKESKELDEKFTQTELGALKDALAKKEQEARLKDERLATMEATLRVMQQHFPAIAELVEEKPSVAAVEEALARKPIG